MRRISIIVNNALAKRQFLCTPLFDILKSNPQNNITIFTQPSRLSKKFNSDNVRICSYQNFLWLRKLGFRRSSIVFWAFKLLGIKKSDVIILASWIDEELVKVLKLTSQLNIPTLFVQEGMGNPWESYSTAIYPTKLAVWGDVAKNAYINRGISPDRITVTGQPRFDLYHGFDRKMDFSKKDTRKNILYVTQPLWKEPEKFPDGKNVIVKTFDIIYCAAKELKLQLVCKLHPSDKEDFYKKDDVFILKDKAVSPKNYLKWYCNTGYDPNSEDMRELGCILLSSDVIVTVFSTVGLEGMMLNKPVIFLDIANYAEKEPVSKSLTEKAGFALASNKEEFIKLINRYLVNPDIDVDVRNKFVYDFAFKQDGNTSKRVADLIDGMLS